MREILIQEDYRNEPWKMLVCCILLNQTNNKQVRPILSSVFELIPNPQSAALCDKRVLADYIKTTGLQNIKADRIVKLSNKWLSGFTDVRELPGIGEYGRDSWKIFIEGDLKISPADKKLRGYLNTLSNQG